MQTVSPSVTPAKVAGGNSLVHCFIVSIIMQLHGAAALSANNFSMGIAFPAANGSIRIRLRTQYMALSSVTALTGLVRSCSGSPFISYAGITSLAARISCGTSIIYPSRPQNVTPQLRCFLPSCRDIVQQCAFHRKGIFVTGGIHGNNILVTAVIFLWNTKTVTSPRSSPARVMAFVSATGCCSSCFVHPGCRTPPKQHNHHDRRKQYFSFHFTPPP